MAKGERAANVILLEVYVNTFDRFEIGNGIRAPHKAVETPGMPTKVWANLTYLAASLHRM